MKELYYYKIKVLKIYDGDTITVEVDLGYGVSKIQKIRFYGINAPELRGEERPMGLKSRDWLRNKISQAVQENKQILLKSYKDKTGKYGRYLGEIFIESFDTVSLNTQLVNEQLAVFKDY